MTSLGALRARGRSVRACDTSATANGPRAQEATASSVPRQQRSRGRPGKLTTPSQSSSSSAAAVSANVAEGVAPQRLAPGASVTAPADGAVLAWVLVPDDLGDLPNGAYVFTPSSCVHTAAAREGPPVFLDQGPWSLCPSRSVTETPPCTQTHARPPPQLSTSHPPLPNLSWAARQLQPQTRPQASAAVQRRRSPSTPPVCLSNAFACPAQRRCLGDTRKSSAVMDGYTSQT
jgi:hypothetical protein